MHPDATVNCSPVVDSRTKIKTRHLTTSSGSCTCPRVTEAEKISHFWTGCPKTEVGKENRPASLNKKTQCRTESTLRFAFHLIFKPLRIGILLLRWLSSASDRAEAYRHCFRFHGLLRPASSADPHLRLTDHR